MSAARDTKSTDAIGCCSVVTCPTHPLQLFGKKFKSTEGFSVAFRGGQEQFECRCGRVRNGGLSESGARILEFDYLCPAPKRLFWILTEQIASKSAALIDLLT